MLRSIFIIISLFLGVAATQAQVPAHYEGKNYILDYSKSIAVDLKKTDGSLQPFLAGIDIECATMKWEYFFRSSGFRAVLKEQTESMTSIEFQYEFTGRDADRVTMTGTIEAHPEWLKINLDGVCKSDIGKAFFRRANIRYASPDVSLHVPFAETGIEDQPYGIKAEMQPELILTHNAARKLGSVNLIWEKNDDGSYRTSQEIVLVPYRDQPPLFNRISGRDYEACFEFARPCSVLLEGDRPESVLHFYNRTKRKFDGRAVLKIQDYRQNNVSSQILELTAAPGEIIRRKIEVPATQYGYFAMTLEVDGTSVSTHSYCVLPPVARPYKSDSIFGGIIYPWNRKTVEKLDLMNWIGMSTIRRAYPIAAKGVVLPSRPKSGVYSKEDAARIFHEQEARGIEPIALTTSILEMPAGTFRLTEGTNEENIRRLPADFAEQMKIEYIKAKLHDPAVMVGSTGTAGVDIHWFEEMQDSGVWDYMDAIFVHLHCFPRAPEVNNIMTREFWLHDRVTLLRELMDKYGEKAVYDSENGYLTLDPNRRVENYPLRSISEQNIAAAFMVRSYLQSLAYGLKNKMWFTIDSYGGFGITERNQPLPAYPAYGAMTLLLDGAKYAGELLSPGRVSSAMDRNEEFSRSWFGQATPGLEKELLAADRETVKTNRDPDLKPYLYIRAFRTRDGKPVLAAWATLKRQDVVKHTVPTPAWMDQKPGTPLLWNGFPVKEEPQPIPVRFNTGSKEIEVADMMGNRRRIKTENGFITLSLDDYPQFILGADAGLLAEAGKFNLRLFPSELKSNNNWKPLVQLVLPKEQTHPPRKAVFDKPNLSAVLEAGKPYPVYVRLSNLSGKTENGNITLKLPDGWKCTPAKVSFTIMPNTEKHIAAEFTVIPDNTADKVKIRSIVHSDRSGKIADSTMNVGVE